MNNYSINRSNVSRSGLQDIWNAFMVEGAKFSVNDIPMCPTTTSKIPSKLISFDDAKAIHKREMRRGNKDYKVEGFVHFFIDDQKFDGKRSSIWLYPEKTIEILKHFSGIIAPDFSTYADFPEPLKKWNYYRMCAFGYWAGMQGISVISNCRWGTEETWSYCFDGNPSNSMLAIGVVASGIRHLENRPLFEQGLFKMVEQLHPHTIIVYGSASYACFDEIKRQGIKVVFYPSKTSLAFAERRVNE